MEFIMEPPRQYTMETPMWSMKPKPTMDHLMKHPMIRACRPKPSIRLGITRMSCDPERTRYYLVEGTKKRNRECFLHTLRTFSHKIPVFRSLWRLIQRALFHVLREDRETHDLTSNVLSYLPIWHNRQFGPYIPLQYNSLSLPIRFQQMSGRLVELGHPPLQIPVLTLEDVELKIYENRWRLKNFWEFPVRLTALYRQLQRKGIVDKWRIMLSHMNSPAYNRAEWTTHFDSQHADHFLEECARLNPREESLDLLNHWLSVLRYPSRYIID